MYTSGWPHIQNRLMNIIGLQVETAIYRIAQESLTNIAKYADVSKASISLLKQEDTIKMIIQDEGQGFSMEQIK